MIIANNEPPEQINAYQMEAIERLYANFRYEGTLNLNDMHNWTSDEANEFIDFLSRNQLNPVTEKGQYNATQLNDHLRKFI